MSDELEAAGAASVGSLKSEPRGTSADGLCRNCKAPIDDRYCAACGQLAANFHRPVWHLVTEALGDFFALDGRLMRTLPALMFRPGRVTKAYLDGQRARFVPPFRLYILSSLLFFVLLFSVGDRAGWFEERMASPEETRVNLEVDENGVNVTSVDETEAVNPEGTDQAGDPAIAEDEPWNLLLPDGSVNREDLRRELEERNAPPFFHWLSNSLANAYENQRFFYSSVRNWTPRFALLMTPVLILLFALLYAFRRNLYIYDHVITALHFQSWIYLLLTGLMLLGWVGFPGTLLWIIGVLAPPIYLYRMQRTALTSSRVLGVPRTLVLLGLSTLVIGLLILGVMGAGLWDLG